MTARPPFDEHDALGPEERELAARLSALDAGGPSAALDARILAAARAAAAPARAPQRRRARRWPTAVGAAATLAIAVGLAWQLKPLVDMPPPLRREAASAASTEAEILAQAESAPAPAAPPAVEDAAADAAAPAATAAPALARVASGARASARAAKVQQQAPPDAMAPSSHDFVDEAVGDYADVASAAAVAPAAAPPPAPMAVEAQERMDLVESRAAARMAQQDLDRVEVTGSRIARPVAEDAALPPIEWLARIRERRDAGDVDGARESLRRFVREYPRHRLPDDLRALRAPPR